MRRAASAFMLLSLFQVSSLAAQGTAPVDVGRRVRVRTDSGNAFIGTLVGQDTVALQVRVPSWAVTRDSGDRDSLVVMVPRNHLRQFEISAGRRSNAGKGLAIGFGAGAAVGLAAG